MDVDRGGSVIIKEFEDAGDTLTALLIAKLISDRLQELLKVDAVRVFVGVQIGNHGVNGWVLGLETQRRHCCFQFARVNPTMSISVEKSKSLTNLLNLVLSEAWSLEDSASDG